MGGDSRWLEVADVDKPRVRRHDTSLPSWCAVLPVRGRTGIEVDFPSSQLFFLPVVHSSQASTEPKGNSRPLIWRCGRYLTSADLAIMIHHIHRQNIRFCSVGGKVNNYYRIMALERRKTPA